MPIAESRVTTVARTVGIGMEERIATLEAELELSRVKVAELRREVDEAAVDSLEEGYEQALRNLKNVTDGTALVTWQLGPSAGLEYLLAALRNMEIDTTPGPDVPHDWLSRWTVTDRVSI